MRSAAALPIDIASSDSADSGTQLQVDVLDQSISRAAGVNGFAFSLAAPAEALGSDASDHLSVEVGVDVSGLRGTYGGNYLDRLQVVALPACALVTPRPEGCDASGTVLPSTRDDASPSKLVVAIDDLNSLLAVGLEGDVAVPGGAPDVAAPVPPSETVPAPESPAEVATTAPSTTTTEPPGDEDGEPVPEQDGAAGDTSTTSESDLSTTTTALDPGSSSTSVPGPAPAEMPPEGDAAVVAAVPGTEGTVVLALTAGVEGSSGSYRATSFNQSSEWLAGVGTGEFSWSYPIPAPAPPAGEAPSVAAAYSSGAVDGMVTTSNNQPSALGLGWAEFANAFIERRYARCTDEGFGTGDMCWKTDNATLSLNGEASELVPTDGTFRQWRLKSDPNWRVERFDTSDGALSYNDDNNDERWRVTTPDGTEYWFGLAPAWTPTQCTSGGAAAEVTAFTGGYRCDPESVWTTPVWGDDPGDACYVAPPGTNLPCKQAWRWNLDYVVDPNDNVTSYAYREESNRYLVAGGFLGADWYSAGGTLELVQYGGRPGQDDGSHYLHFITDERCSTFPDTIVGCPKLDPDPTSPGYNAGIFPDVPADLVCGGTATCTATSPTFFSQYRYRSILVNTTGVGQSDEVKFLHTFQSDGFGNYHLWLTGIQRVGSVGGGTFADACGQLLGLAASESH